MGKQKLSVLSSVGCLATSLAPQRIKRSL